MEGVRQWAFSICVAMVVGGITRMLIPKGGPQKVVSVTVSVFFLCVMISPLMGKLPAVSFDMADYTQTTPDIEAKAKALTDTVSGQSEEIAQNSLRKIIADKLSGMGIKYSRITININTNGQNETQVESADIVLDRIHENEHDSIRKTLETEFGIKIRLGYESAEAEYAGN